MAQEPNTKTKNVVEGGEVGTQKAAESAAAKGAKRASAGADAAHEGGRARAAVPAQKAAESAAAKGAK